MKMFMCGTLLIFLKINGSFFVEWATHIFRMSLLNSEGFWNWPLVLTGLICDKVDICYFVNVCFVLFSLRFTSFYCCCYSFLFLYFFISLFLKHWVNITPIFRIDWFLLIIKIIIVTYIYFNMKQNTLHLEVFTN